METEKIILGIDPGTIVMGYGILQQKGKELSILRMGVLKLGKLDNQALKLKKIFERMLEIIEEYKPDEMAIEAPFFGKNVQSMLKLGRAQGVAMAAALYRDIPIFEYAPRTIKQTITGNGNASKEQVSKMLQAMLRFKEVPEFFDATDALAAAVCHHLDRGKDVNYTKPKHSRKSASSQWTQFVKQNPDRLTKIP
ncbi:MAG: crossover junction endodeoxyribonuclease RuvC [Bacteroidales bacterium]|nr:crossover junction endodeoxyribonuclease RuvC [Bacteroidales bacterium]